jgi:hypothetical protein
MAYFPDLSPYAYGHGSHPGVVHVGWLDGIHPFSQGTLDTRLFEKMKLLAAKPVELYRGSHICELGPEPGLAKETLPNRTVFDLNSPYGRWLAQHKSNGEVRVSLEGITFAAPVLIVHHIQDHGYLPPEQFLRATEAATC